jgi:hypothetical protein
MVGLLLPDEHDPLHGWQECSELYTHPQERRRMVGLLLPDED